MRIDTHKLETTLNKMEKGIEQPMKEIILFVKKHKKILMVSAVLYFVYNYLFSEEEG